MALRLVSRSRPGRLIPNPAFDLADEREIAGISSHEDESVISGGRRYQTVVQKTAAETAWAQVSALDQPSHDERRPRPGRVAGSNHPPEILERSNPVLVVLAVIGLVSGAGENLLGDRRVLEQKRRARR
jgi:hypothetical protein